MPDPVIPDDRGADGTAGADGIETPVLDDDVFASAFEKAEEEGDKADLSAADDPKNQKDEEEMVKVDGEPPVKTEAEIAAETAAVIEAAKVKDEPVVEPVIEDAAKIEQKYKTLQGIHRHDKETWEEEKTTLLSQLEEAKKPIEPDAKKPTKGEIVASAEAFKENLTDDQKAELEAYETDFDTVSRMEGLKRERELNALRKDMQEWKESVTAEFTATKSQVEPAIKLIQDNETDAHFNAIRDGYTLDDGTVVEGHNDYENYVKDGSLKTWIETKPAYIRRGMERVYNQGNVQDAIDLFTDFKRENNISIQTPSDNVVDLESKRTSKKAALVAVDTRRAAVQARSAVATNYEDAFDEALNKLGG